MFPKRNAVHTRRKTNVFIDHVANIHMCGANKEQKKNKRMLKKERNIINFIETRARTNSYVSETRFRVSRRLNENSEYNPIC